MCGTVRAEQMSIVQIKSESMVDWVITFLISCFVGGKSGSVGRH